MTEFNLDEYLRQLSESQEIDDCPKVPVPDIAKNQKYLFVSYSHKDFKEVYSDLAHLYTSGVRFWYDKGLTVGRDWEIEVKEHIHDHNCCGIVFYISTNMFLSDSILKEIGFTQTWKKGILIRQKKYFCVNLHNESISKVLHDAQNIKEASGQGLLSTKVTNKLTSIFSDDDTYIVYGSKFHLEDMIGQIRKQFNVVGDGEENNGKSGFLSEDVPTPKAALNAFFGGNIDTFKLCRYIYTVHKEKTLDREWYMLPIGTAISLLTMCLTLFDLFRPEEIPFVILLREYFSEAFIVSLAAVFCPLLTVDLVIKLFWLYYLSPVYDKCERNNKLKITNNIIFICGSMLCAIIVPLAYIMLLLLLLILKNGSKTYDRVIEIFKNTLNN